MKKVVKAFTFLFILYWLPFIYVFTNYHPNTNIKTLRSSGTVVIFDTLVRNDQVSPLLKERLDAGVVVYNTGKIDSIIVSNTKQHLM